MRKGILYLFAAGALVLIVSIGWWTRDYLQQQKYIVQLGDTVVSIAAELEVSPRDLATANGASPENLPLEPGDELIVPAPSATSLAVWRTHGVGVAGEILGVFMSLWLALVAGLLPKTIRRQILGISLVLGLTSYATIYAVVPAPLSLTPAFLFATIKDGFAWAAAFPMLARALGIRDAPSTPPGDALAPVVPSLPPEADTIPDSGNLS